MSFIGPNVCMRVCVCVLLLYVMSMRFWYEWVQWGVRWVCACWYGTSPCTSCVCMIVQPDYSVHVCGRERERGVFIGLKWVPALHEYAVTPCVSTDVSLMSACVWETSCPGNNAPPKLAWLLQKKKKKMQGGDVHIRSSLKFKVCRSGRKEKNVAEWNLHDLLWHP